MGDFVIQIDEFNRVSFLLNNGGCEQINSHERLYYYGCILNNDELRDIAIRNLKENQPVDKELKGYFTLIYMNDDEELDIIQDDFGGGFPVYYTRVADIYYVFSSLKEFKQLGLMKFELNSQVVDEFIYNGVIKSRDTLVKGIYKLLPKQIIAINEDTIEVKAKKGAEFQSKNIDIQELYELEKSIICEYLEFAKNEFDEVSLALSGGYDSNLLLHIAKEKNITANAFSCGGARGVDETMYAKQIGKLYDRVSVTTGLVRANIRNCISDIATRLEGTLYERGVFLQYVLAKLLYESDIKRIVLGECADQVFNENFYNEPRMDFLMDYIHNPFELGSMLVLKKSTMMLKSFGIEGVYPFIDPRMISIGYSVRKHNKTTKEYQKKMCASVIKKEVYKKLEKQGGSTSLSSLFVDDIDEESFIEYVKSKNEFYKPGFRINYKYEKHESDLDYYLCLEYLKAFKTNFCSK